MGFELLGIMLFYFFWMISEKKLITDLEEMYVFAKLRKFQDNNIHQSELKIYSKKISVFKHEYTVMRLRKSYREF